MYLFRLLTLKGGAVTRQPGGASGRECNGERGFFPFSPQGKGSPSIGMRSLEGISSAESRTGCITSFGLQNKLCLWLLGVGRLTLIFPVPGHRSSGKNMQLHQSC